MESGGYEVGRKPHWPLTVGHLPCAHPLAQPNEATTGAASGGKRRGPWQPSPPQAFPATARVRGGCSRPGSGPLPALSQPSHSAGVGRLAWQPWQTWQGREW